MCFTKFKERPHNMSKWECFLSSLNISDRRVAYMSYSEESVDKGLVLSWCVDEEKPKYCGSFYFVKFG